MDFHQVTSTLLREFGEQAIDYAVMGGFALGFWGVTRATIDIDLLLLIDDAPRAESILDKYHYHPVHKTENVAQYASDLTPYGSIDILYAFRSISRSMLSRSVTITISDDLVVKSLIPEDIIGLKLQALVNDPSRQGQDLADVEALLQAKQRRQEAVDWELLREYFELFDRSEILADLLERYGQVE